jgi:hypothetical protein
MGSTELARLRRIAGRQTTRLTHYGRKTGKAREVTMWFVLDRALHRDSEREAAMGAERLETLQFRTAQIKRNVNPERNIPR